MNKKKLQKLLAKLEAKKAGLVSRSATVEAVAELRSINTELEGLNGEITELRGIVESMPDEEEEPPAGGATPPEQRGAQPPVGNAAMTQFLKSFGIGGQSQERSEEPADPYGTVEYRNAFMIYAKTGEIKPELRANATTTTADVSAVIPTTILNEIIKKVTVYGQVFSRVRKLNIKGGVEVPILALKPVATWIGEAAVSDKQKVQANTKLTFTYFGLECKVAISLLADTVTLAGFETVITDLIVEAMVKAIDMSVIKGTGIGQPKGITVDDRVPAGQIVTMTPTEFASWESWKKKVTSKLPLAYKAGATWLMASGTFEGYIDGMVDDNGQPIGRVNYGIADGPQERFAGKEVIQVEDDVIAPYESAAAGDVVAILLNLKNFGWNSNMQMTMFRYFDHDTNEWVDKAILIADGKLIDPNGVVIVKKGTAS
ncbi:phage major capsid protein [Paenibacillus donghaensis]|uniref:Phage major capsid protein n=1 Tax=Paenibacillus donghaensis TaxID=414771 RepID=A0A2Z2KHP2_9BACL|nr:phage major capsid protein [Paenibacillus donghaensis]ASA25417.1 phage major capsid protein [Paenibacillus donghaensis]